MQENTVKNKTAIIIGMANSRHLYNFANSILESQGFHEVVIFNVAEMKDISDELSDYYKLKAFKIINIKDKIKTPLRQLNSLINFWLRGAVLKKYLKSHGAFSHCFIHYIAWQSVKWVNENSHCFDRIYPVAWGGDILRNTRLSNDSFCKLFLSSYRIVLPNLNSLYVFNKKTDNAFADKAFVIQFPKKMVLNMRNIGNVVNKQSVKESFSLPEDKLIVICGHTATRAEQYEQMIASLVKCDEEVLGKCFFVFMMTYAPDDYVPYQQEMETLLSKTKLSWVVLKDFIPYEKVLELHYVSDIHITSIVTDAFSCFLQEELIAGSALIYGKWLNYFEIENDNFVSFPFDSFEDMPEVFMRVVKDYKMIAPSLHKNKSGIEKIASEEAIVNAWSEIL